MKSQAYVAFLMESIYLFENGFLFSFFARMQAFMSMYLWIQKLKIVVTQSSSWEVFLVCSAFFYFQTEALPTESNTAADVDVDHAASCYQLVFHPVFLIPDCLSQSPFFSLFFLFISVVLCLCGGFQNPSESYIHQHFRENNVLNYDKEIQFGFLGLGGVKQNSMNSVLCTVIVVPLILRGLSALYSPTDINIHISVSTRTSQHTCTFHPSSKC